MGAAKALKWLKQNRVSMAVDFLVRQNRPAQAFDDCEKKIWPKIKSVLKPCRSLCTCSTFLASPVP